MIYLNKHKVEYVTFPNKERRLDLNKELLTTKNNILWKYEDDSSIFELFLFDDAMKSLDATYTLTIGYMPYSRMDRIQNLGTAFSLDILTRLMSQLQSVNDIKILDPHSPVTLEKFKEYGMNVQECEFSIANDVLQYTKLDINDAWFIFPDKGAANRYDCDLYPNSIICEKVRNFQTGKIESIKAHIHKQTTVPTDDAPLIIIDDLCSYGGTFVGAVAAVKNDLNIDTPNRWLIITHAEDAIDFGQVPSTFSKIFTTDSIAKPHGYVDMSEKQYNENNKVFIRPVLTI